MTTIQRIYEFKIAIVIAGAVLLISSCDEHDAAESGAIESVMKQMATDGDQFDPTVLHDLGESGLDRLLDHLLWQMPEAEGYAGRFLEQYENHVKEKEQYTAAFHIYVHEIDDRPRLMLLANRVRKSLEDHRLGRVNERGRIFRSSFEALARHKDDEYLNVFDPLLKHSEIEVAKFVVRESANRSPKDYFPELLLTALESPRPELAMETLDWVPNCWDEERKPDLKKSLIRLFNGDDEMIQFNAAFPLLHDFGHEPAIDFLIMQASNETENGATAAGWLSDGSNYPGGAPADMQARLSPLLNADSSKIQSRGRDILKAVEQ